MRTLLLLIRNRTKVQLDNLRFYTRKLNPNDTDKMEVGKNPRAGQATVSNGKRISAIFLTILHRFFSIVGRLVCRFVYGEKGAAMPPINDLVLTESATAIAAKIRSGKVSDKTK